jgi:cardiolipin synthase
MLPVCAPCAPSGIIFACENLALTPARQLSEDIMTLPNVLTMLRLASCPVLGYLIATGQLKAGVALLFVAGASDALDGYIARKRGSFTVFGSIADPAADKALMTTMVVALAYRGLLPSEW